MLLNDTQISQLDNQLAAERGQGLFTPFVPYSVKSNELGERLISYGLSSAGYDIRAADTWKVFQHKLGATNVIDPKNIDPANYAEVSGLGYIDIPGNSYVLTHSVEQFWLPNNIMAIVLGKSTYARVGLLVNTTPGEPCFSDDTEILTPTGWRLIKDVELGDLVMGMSTEGKAEWQPVYAKQDYAYNGDMHHYAGRAVDLLVTPDHKLLVRRRSNSKSSDPNKQFTPWYTTESKNVFGGYNFEMSRRLDWVGTPPPENIVIGKNTFPYKNFLIFLGLWLGDGSAFVLKNSNYVIQLAAIRERKREFGREILTRLGLKFTEYDRGFRMYNKDLCEYLLPYRHAKNKHVPQEFWELDKESLTCLWEGILNSDGNAETQTVKTVSKQLADDIQRLAFMMGRGAIVRTEVTKDAIINGTPAKGGSDLYIVRLVGDQLTPKMSPHTHKLQHYEGRVYDVTVPNHLIFVRRNGKAIWSGNCWKGFLTIEVANLSAIPVRVYANEGIAQVLLFQVAPVGVSYADRGGKYQDQPAEVVHAKME